MSHKFRFSEKCIDRLKEYCGMWDKSARSSKKQPARKKEQEAPVPAAQPVVHEVPEFVIPEIDGIIALTDKGCVRPSNQDAVIVAPGLAGVADGMGGHRGGEVASSSTRDLLIGFLDGKMPDEEGLKTAVENVNQRIFIRQDEDEKLSGMGTTLTVLWFDEASVIIGHVGDSRAYRLRDGELKQITEDHSLVAELVRKGMLTPDQAACHPMRNVITRAVGTEAGIEVDIMTEERRAGDVWLVCSDGLHGLVSDEEMAKTLRENAPAKAAELLMQAALDAGGRDNISVVVLQDKEGAR